MAKKQYVEAMFNDISPTYDRLNHLLSLNVDRRWRRQAVRQLMACHPERVLDVACGTGDFSIALARAGVPRVLGVDISAGMLAVGQRKVAEAGLSDVITLQADDCEALSSPAGCFDAVSVAFGVRNFEHLQQGLTEMHRVLRPGGLLLVLELSVPQNRLLRWCYEGYFLHVLPFVGGLFSGHPQAYRYLPVSVLRFPAPAQFGQMLREAGFARVEPQALTFGLCRIFRAYKAGAPVAPSKHD